MTRKRDLEKNALKRMRYICFECTGNFKKETALRDCFHATRDPTCNVSVDLDTGTVTDHKIKKQRVPFIDKTRGKGKGKGKEITINKWTTAPKT